MFGDHFIHSAEDPGVEDVFNALKPEMQQITSREEVGAVIHPFFPQVWGGGFRRGDTGDRLNKGPI